MYCPKCGVILEDNQRYCGNCGTELASNTVAQTSLISSGTGEHAGFWRRFVAWIIDTVIIYAAYFLMTGLFFITGGYSFVFSILSIAIIWLYYSIMESSSTQATLGKMALGIVVTDMSGNRVSFGRATGRYFAKIISGLILNIGFLMIAFTEKKQGLHDILADTLVEVKSR